MSREYELTTEREELAALHDERMAELKAMNAEQDRMLGEEQRANVELRSRVADLETDLKTWQHCLDEVRKTLHLPADAPIHSILVAIAERPTLTMWDQLIRGHEREKKAADQGRHEILKHLKSLFGLPGHLGVSSTVGAIEKWLSEARRAEAERILDGRDSRVNEAALHGVFDRLAKDLQHENAALRNPEAVSRLRELYVQLAGGAS